MNQIAKFTGTLKKSTGKKRQGPVLFPGDYGDRGAYTKKSLDTLVKNFTICPVNVEHTNTPFDGKLGSITRIWVANDATGEPALFAEWDQPQAVADILGNDPAKVSCEINLSVMRLQAVSLTNTPHLASAALFSASRKTAREADLENQLEAAKAEYSQTLSVRIAAEIIASREKAAGGI